MNLSTIIAKEANPLNDLNRITKNPRSYKNMFTDIAKHSTRGVTYGFVAGTVGAIVTKSEPLPLGVIGAYAGMGIDLAWYLVYSSYVRIKDAITENA